MRYTYNEAAGVTNGVIFFFERGDELTCCPNQAAFNLTNLGS